MLTENTINDDDLLSSAESSEDESLDWLLDEDYEEPKDTLFALSEESFDTSLSETELEMASRPMARGDSEFDSLDSFVEEEIVIGSVGDSSDIYSKRVEPDQSLAGQNTGFQSVPLPIARVKPGNDNTAVNSSISLDEGADLLGLIEQDDMGEKPLVIQRISKAESLASPSELVDQASVSKESPAVADEQLVAHVSVDVVDEERVDQHSARSINLEPETQPDQIESVVDTEFTVEGVTSTGQLQSLDEQADAPTLSLALPSHENENESETLDSSDGFFELEFEGSDASLDAMASALDNEQESQHKQDDLNLSVEKMEEIFDLDFDEGSSNNYEEKANPLPEDIEGLKFTDSDIDSNDALFVAQGEGRASMDSTMFDETEYHEDFAQFDTGNSISVASITEVLEPLMSALTSAIALELKRTHAPADSVDAQLIIAASDDEALAVENDGYVAITSLGIELPCELERLGQLEIDAIKVRLVHKRTGQCCNDLFIQGDDGDNPHEQNTFYAEELVYWSDGEGSGAAHGQSYDQPDILSRQPTVDDSDIVDFPIADSANDQDFDTAIGLSDIAVAMRTIPTDQFDKTSVEPMLMHTEQGATEDIFGGDLEDIAFTEGYSTTDTDEDALFASLSLGEVVSEDTCGISPEALADADELPSEGSTATVFKPIEQQAAVPIQSLDSVEDAYWCVPDDIDFSLASASSGEIVEEFLAAFIEEAATELEKLEDGIAQWEKNYDGNGLPDTVLRTLHTLKGIAKSVGLQRYGTLIHNFETLLEQLEMPVVGTQDHYLRIVSAWLNAAVAGFETIEATREDVGSELPGPTIAPPEPADSLTTQPLQEIPAHDQVAAAEIDSSRVEVAVPTTPEVPQNFVLNTKPVASAGEGVKALANQQTIRMTADAIDHLMNLTNQAQQLGVRSSQSTVRSKLATSELQARLSSVRANVNQIADKALLSVTAQGRTQTSELDALEMDQYSEIQEAANLLREGVEDLSELIAQTNRQNILVEALLKQQASAITSLRGSIQAARVIPVSRLMPSLRRIIRSASADLGKSVTFRVLQEIGSLDRDSHARCQVILEHMVRNALDHGIESAEQRARAGKPGNGQITIDVRKDGSDYVITLADDGRGMDPDALREAAVKRGLDTDVDALSDEEALKLIFHKGFSTASKVSEISGRGVGMDIVMSEIQQLGGDISISSVLGEGTTFDIRIPANLTVNGALLVSATTQSYAIPLDGLIAIEHIPVEDFFEAVAQKSMLTLFGLECEPTYLATLCSGESLPERSAWGATVPVIIAGSDRRTMAIAVDDVKQALELVIRGLGAQFASVPGLAGGTTTADGQAIVALDLNSLVESMGDEPQSALSVAVEARERMLVMVVDDSRTQRMVATSLLEKLGVETLTAENGLIAIDLLNDSHRLPDVILLDIEMPVKDGIQMLREVRKSPSLSHIPVIMVTSRTGAKHRRLAEEAGCNDFMGKPFNFPLLVQRINALTGHDLQLN